MILGVPPRPGLRIMLAAQPVDFRKGMDSLAALVAQALGGDPFVGDIFVFRSKRSDRLKILVWDGTGLWPIRMVAQFVSVTSIRQSGSCRFADDQAGSPTEGNWSRMGAFVTHTGGNAGVGYGPSAPRRA